MNERNVLATASGAPSPRRWGVTYRGVGEVSDAAAATANALAGLGVACTVARVAEGVVSIDGETRKPWHRLLVGAHPQRVRGRIEERPSETADRGREAGLRLSLDLLFLDWYRRLVVGLWIFWVIALCALFWYTDPEQFRGGDRPSTVLLVGVFVALATVAWVPFLMRALGGARVQTMLWQPILGAIDRTGGYLEPEGSGAGRRFGLWWVSYGTSFFLFGGGALVLDALQGSWEASRGWFWFMLLLVALAALFLGSAFALGVWRGFGLRVEALVLGLGSSVFVLFLLAVPLVPAMTVKIAATLGEARPGEEGWWARIIVVGTGLILLFGIGLGLYSLSLSRYVWRPLERTYALRGRPGVYRDAVGGGALLAAARGFFGLYAVALAGVVVVTLLLAAAWAGQALGLVDFEASTLRAPALSGAVLALALGLPPETAWAGVAARAAWVGWAVAVWLLFGLSVGQLACRRHRLRRRLERRSSRTSRARPVLSERVERLARRTGGPAVCLAVSPGRAIGAFSHRFLWPRRRWYVEVSKGALEHLEPDEIEALVAHELVHLGRGHVLAHDLLRWFGRVAFVGDGFCRGLLDSFGWELVADREAVEMLGERRQALVRCLWKIAAINPARPALVGAEGLAMDAPSGDRGARDSGDGGASGRQSLRVAWRRFLWQYLGGSGLHYWHPIPDERVARIQRLEEMTDPSLDYS